jgi:hypothetical protein
MRARIARRSRRSVSAPFRQAPSLQAGRMAQDQSPRAIVPPSQVPIPLASVRPLGFEGRIPAACPAIT